MDSSTSHRASYEPWRLAALWAGILTGPIVWLTLLETQYVLSYVACETGATWFMHASTGIALVLVGGAAWAAWSASDGSPYDDDGQERPVGVGTRRQRCRWMSLAGLALSAWFALVILAMEVPILILGVCQ
jgi:hypothetical protein